MLRGAAALAAAAAVASGCGRGQPKYPEVRAAGGVVTVDTAGLPAGHGRFLSYRSPSGRTADFFVYRDGAGAARAVLDACRTCARWKMGYLLEGEQVRCVKCGMRFPLDTLAAGTGSCVPIALTGDLQDGRIVIPAAELEAGLRFF